MTEKSEWTAPRLQALAAGVSADQGTQYAYTEMGHYTGADMVKYSMIFKSVRGPVS